MINLISLKFLWKIDKLIYLILYVTTKSQAKREKAQIC